ncbi:MAG TPA: carboxypeptidase-like regulatory domain-containing protein [Thermoanaerobaculia bacterium]
MTALRKSVPLILAIALLGQAAGVRAEVRRPGVGGLVRGESSPLSAAHVWAYQIADLSLRRVALTDSQGNFFLQDLPAGLYKIIAHKAGFAYVVIPLPRKTAKDYQHIEVDLPQRPAGQAEKGDDFWGLVSQVPSDVLHQIEAAEADDEIRQLTGFGMGNRLNLSLPGNFRTEWLAQTGVDDFVAPGSGGQISGASVGIQGTLGEMQVGFQGHITELSSGGTFQPAGGGLGTGQSSSVAFDVAHGQDSRVSVRSQLFNNRLGMRGESGDYTPVDLQNYQATWSQNVGENGHSDVALRYTEENNFHRPAAALVPLDIPDASRTLNFEWAYTEKISDSNSLQAGLRYRQRQFGLGDTDRPNGKTSNGWQDLSSVDLFSRGGVRVQPAVLMEYGLYSTLSDGTVALTPQGGVVFQMGSNWQLETTAAHRVYRDQPAVPDFLPTLFEQRDLCEQGSAACYQMNLTRKVGNDDSLTFGAAQRKVGDTLRLYFSDDFFDRTESLYLVRGDNLPELRIGFQHKISPKIVTKLDSSLASGGGGLFIASDGLPYQNKVRYLVTSLDTQFLGTSTGIFVAFHHLQQQLDPVGLGRPAPQMDFERLQLMVNQNLNFLLNLASQWAVQLNMELSRGLDPSTNVASDTIRRRILGGIAVKF